MLVLVIVMSLVTLRGAIAPATIDPPHAPMYNTTCHGTIKKHTDGEGVTYSVYCPDPTNANVCSAGGTCATQSAGPVSWCGCGDASATTTCTVKVNSDGAGTRITCAKTGCTGSCGDPFIAHSSTNGQITDDYYDCACSP